MKIQIVLMALLGLAGSSARAGMVVVLDFAAQTGSPGDTLIFSGTLSNTGPGTIFLNSADLNLAGNSFTPDFADPFLNNVPVSLDSGQTTSDIELFEVLLNTPFTDPPGIYSGNYALLGGTDSDAQDQLVSVDFSITAQNGTSTAPEPSSIALLAAALAGLAAGRYRRRAA